MLNWSSRVALREDWTSTCLELAVVNPFLANTLWNLHPEAPHPGSFPPQAPPKSNNDRSTAAETRAREEQPLDLSRKSVGSDDAAHGRLALTFPVVSRILFRDWKPLSTSKPPIIVTSSENRISTVNNRMRSPKKKLQGGNRI